MIIWLSERGERSWKRRMVKWIRIANLRQSRRKLGFKVYLNCKSFRRVWKKTFYGICLFQARFLDVLLRNNKSQELREFFYCPESQEELDFFKI